ncbi:hypothetical protein BUE80_DR007903 [Diplocarpon rosae]|nr:hypothetical protein BUE80_DR007903 [Diplocarpon rosae]
MGKKKIAAAAKVQAGAKTAPGASKDRLRNQERRARKLLERRKKEKKSYTAMDWSVPAPSHLVAKLDLPRVKFKHQSYFEFTENPEKRQKKLEFQVTNKPPPPGFMFVPIGDPVLTNACKELSRSKDAMIFIVSAHNLKEENSKISEHVHRTGYYFRETIVEEARGIVGETVILNSNIQPGTVEPIPEAQDEINKQADSAIRDLFPRIPNTDRVMIIEHAFKKGAEFHGEPTVGLQANIPLSRRVQLAVLAHIRHTHTRYDKLLKETSWMNARKAVEPVCLDILIKWRGDEETGRDQMDEILREVVIITDSEDDESDEDEDSDEDESSDEDDSEEGEITSAECAEFSAQPNSRHQRRPSVNLIHHKHNNTTGPLTGRTNVDAISSRTRAKNLKKKEHRGFKRYQAAWEDALSRQQIARAHTRSPYGYTESTRPRSKAAPSSATAYDSFVEMSRPDPAYWQYGWNGSLGNEVNAYSTARPAYCQDFPRRSDATEHQDVRQQYGTMVNSPYKTTGAQPPQVVRRSPVKHGLQDLLVQSIETVQSDISSTRRDEWHGPVVRDGFNQSRVISHRTQSPAPRQVIVINDDSPQVKRRRLVRENDSSHFRPFPARENSTFAPPSHSDSLTLKSSSSVRNGFYDSNALGRHPRLESTQGMSLSDTQSFYTDPTTGERLPIYDAPEDSRYETHPGPLGRSDGGPVPFEREATLAMRQVVHSQLPHGDIYRRRPLGTHNSSKLPDLGDGGIRQPAFECATQNQKKSIFQELSVSHQPSRSYNSAPNFGSPDHAFIQSFSNSTIDGSLRPSKNGFNTAPSRVSQSHICRENLAHMESSVRSSTPPGQRRSIVRDRRSIEKRNNSPYTTIKANVMTLIGIYPSLAKGAASMNSSRFGK